MRVSDIKVGQYFIPWHRSGATRRVLFMMITAINAVKRVEQHQADGTAIITYDRNKPKEVSWAIMSDGRLYAYRHHFNPTPYDEFEAKLLLLGVGHE